MFLEGGQGAAREALLLASGGELYCLYFVLDMIILGMARSLRGEVPFVFSGTGWFARKSGMVIRADVEQIC